MKKVYLPLIVFVLSVSNLFAQSGNDSSAVSNYKPILPVYRDVLGDSTVISKKKQQQQLDFEKGIYSFPPKPKNKWEVGLNVGGLFISGDVATRGGWGIGANVRKSFGYVVSVKGQILHGTTYGLNWTANGSLANNPVLRGDKKSNIQYGKDVGIGYKPKYLSNRQVFFYNYKTNIDEISAEMILTLNNIGYHKVSRDRKFNLYGGIGGGAMLYDAYYNALDANGNIYDFNSIKNSLDYKDRKKTISALKNMMDNTYETPVEGQPDQPHFFDRVFKPIINFSIGGGFHLSKRLSLTIMDKLALTNDDLLDGDRWQEHKYTDPALTGNFDTYHFVSVSLGYFIGGNKRVEPLYWQNPQDYTYDVLQTLIKKNVDQLIDTDDDGVIDQLDREPNTTPGASVNTHGVTLDSDKDGVPNYLDKDPHSPLGVKVDEHGVPLDSDKDGVPDYKDLEPNSAPGALVDVSGRTITGGGGTAVASSGYWYLPMIFFDLDKDAIKPEMYPELKYVATVMQMYPDIKIVTYGNTDVRASLKYNENLSMRRANNAKDHLVKVYGIDPDRIIVKYAGKTDNLIKGLPERFDEKYEGAQYFNRRVEFKVYDPKTDK